MMHQPKVLLTAGPTYEPIDPVRYIGNRSSGQMGLSICREALSRQLPVVAIVGPNQLTWPQSELLTLINVETAQQMYEATMTYTQWYDIGIFSAAVADYTPAKVADTKIKKNDSQLTLTLTKTRDILAAVGAQKLSHQFLVGFALETNDEIAHAQAKITKKNLDLIVLNSLRDPGAGFQHMTNQIMIIDRELKQYPYALKSKDEVAIDIWYHIMEKYRPQV